MRELKSPNCEKKNLRFRISDHHAETVALDCSLLIVAQTGGYIYGMFSIIGCFFAIQDGHEGAQDGFIAEILGLFQTSLQTLFVLNVSWRRCRGQQQNRAKPGREIVTFLLVANMALWFINTLGKPAGLFVALNSASILNFQFQSKATPVSVRPISISTACGRGR